MNPSTLPLIEALHTLYPESSKRTLQNWLKWGRVLVDGAPQTKALFPITNIQQISLDRKESRQHVFGIPILYQDRWIVVIRKPSGLLSVPAESKEANAFHLLKEGLNAPSLLPVHRLDQETSGVLLFARSKMAEEKFNILFEQHALEREYLGIIEGRLPQRSGHWEHFLREKENYDVEITTPELGRRAITHYEVVHTSKKLSFIRFKLETGRKHQIRVQCAQAGHPILGDKRYGSRFNPYKRLCLHAYHLSFIHPFTQKHLSFSSPLNYTQTGKCDAFPFPDIS